MKQAELMAAYRNVLSEARHIMALHRRIEMLIGAATSDGDKLQKAIDAVYRLEEADPDRTTIISGG